MAVHPLRKILIARNHPDGLQGARKELAEIVRCHPDSIRNVDSAIKRPGWPFAVRLEEGVLVLANRHGLKPIKAELLVRAPVREPAPRRSRAA